MPAQAEGQDRRGVSRYLRRPRAGKTAGLGPATEQNHVARIAGVNLPTNKRVVIALQYIHGIGQRKAAGDHARRSNLAAERRVIAAHRRRRCCTFARASTATTSSKAICAVKSRMNIKRLMDLGCYRGLRHRRGLPVRGQRTHTNARTRKGPAKAIAGKKK